MTPPSARRHWCQHGKSPRWCKVSCMPVSLQLVALISDQQLASALAFYFVTPTSYAYRFFFCGAKHAHTRTKLPCPIFNPFNCISSDCRGHELFTEAAVFSRGTLGNPVPLWRGIQVYGSLPSRAVDLTLAGLPASKSQLLKAALKMLPLLYRNGFFGLLPVLQYYQH